jgi:uncharacterized protein (TIGR04222 family)
LGGCQVVRFGLNSGAAQIWPFYPFTLSGPSFLTFYIQWMVVGWLFLKGLDFFLYLSPHSPPNDKSQPDLSPQEIAYLVGGPRNAVSTALLGLLHSGEVTIDGNTLELTSHPPRHHIGLEGVVIQTLQQGVRDVKHLLDTVVVRMDVYKPCVDTLQARGLLLTQSQIVLSNRAARFVLGGLSLLAIARVIQGVSAGRPVFFLIMFNVFSGLPARVDRLSRRGANVISALKRTHRRQLQSTDQADGDLSTPSILASFALLGALVLPADLAHAMEPVMSWAIPVVPSGTGGADGGGGGCSGGGCGGGCGGCGG